MVGQMLNGGFLAGAGAGLRPAAKVMPRLQDLPGTVLQLMVVSTGERHCAGIDLASGALVRAWSQFLVDQRLRPYDLVAVTIGDDFDVVPDPSEPEAVVIAGAPELVGRVKGRRAERLIRPLLHPENTPLLGSHGPTVPFWERTPDQPSAALAAPKGPVMATFENGGMWSHFLWGGRAQVLACADPRLAASMQRAGRDTAVLRPGTRLLVALQPPVEGHCHKVVEALVPLH
ncbi:MAG TPA: hypothetical protein VME46_14915 [Acidimicrobiales bacterium]|nr:hypothetical protein [Acidimicrobiales bacterium]